MIVGRENINVGIEAGCTLISGLPGVKAFTPAGSATYLNEANDIDFLILVDESEVSYEDFCTNLRVLGFIDCGEDYEEGKFAALRLNDLNFIVIKDQGFYERFQLAIRVNECLHLEKKADRMAVCWIIRDGLTPEQVKWQLKGYFFPEEEEGL